MGRCYADANKKKGHVLTISNNQKEMILYLRGKGTSYARIAQSLALSPNSVKSICYRHKKHLGAEQQQEGTGDVCKNCGGPLHQKSGTKQKIFCSDHCRYSWWNRTRNQQPYLLICQQCGREFISYGNRKRKFCGRECYCLSRYGEGLP